ncbi:MAG: hypothetical protein ACRDJE_00650 [Dehalococcoidia bacterium]
MYPWLLFGHLLGVVLLVAGWGIYVASVEGFRRAQAVAQLRTLAGLITVGERVLIAGGPLLIGFGLALVVKFYSFSQTWIIVALALVALQGVLGAAIVGPRVRRLHAALGAAQDGPLAGDLLARTRDRVLHAANRASVPVLIEIEFLMSVKPAGADIALSLLVVAILAVALTWPFIAERAITPPVATTQ